MSVKDRAKMFSSNSTNKGLQEDLLKNKKTKKYSSSLTSSSISSSCSKCGSYCSDLWIKTKKFFEDIWADKKKRYILIGILSFILLLILIIIISSSLSSSTYTGKKYENPNCNGVCSKPYDIKVYTEGILKHKLLECGYKEGSQLFNYALSAIRRHNVVRACHNAQPLMFNCEIMKIAQDYSEHLAKDVQDLVHSKTKFHGEWMGENLAYTSGMTISGETPTNMWYNEIKNYDFNNPGFSLNTGHFTQVVWKDSKEFGIGLYCSGACYMTGNYYPGGNYNNMYSTQVQNLQ